MNFKQGQIKAEIQCPVCGDWYYRPVYAHKLSVQCRSCHTGLYLKKLNRNTENESFLAINVWGGKKEFEDMFLSKKNLVADARMYGFIR